MIFYRMIIRSSICNKWKLPLLFCTVLYDYRFRHFRSFEWPRKCWIKRNYFVFCLNYWQSITKWNLWEIFYMLKNLRNYLNYLYLQSLEMTKDKILPDLIRYSTTIQVPIKHWKIYPLYFDWLKKIPWTHNMNVGKGLKRGNYKIFQCTVLSSYPPYQLRHN